MTSHVSKSLLNNHLTFGYFTHFGKIFLFVTNIKKWVYY